MATVNHSSSSARRGLESRGSVVSGAEGEGVEGELRELQRKYRMLEGDRRAYSEEAQNIIRRQRMQIDKLKKENEKLQEHLATEARSVSSFENAQVAQQLAKLADQKEMYAGRLAREKHKQEDLEKHIKALRDRIHTERSKIGGINAAKEHSQSLNKQVKILENRLQQATQRYNEALTGNRALRDDIDNLRRERVMFENIYHKMERELTDKKRDMAQVIEQSNNAYEARDQAQARIAELRERELREVETFDQRLKEISQQIATDKRNKDFLQLMQGKTGRVDGDEQSRMQKKKHKGQMELEKAKQQSQATTERVQSYEEAFEKIKAATNISDPDEFVTQFIKVEDQNFSLFNYVNELNTEIEKLEEQIADFRSEIEKYRGEGANHDSQRKKILKELEDRLAVTESKAEQYDSMYQNNVRIINNLKSAIQSLFTRIGCDATSVTEMLGNAGVTEHNMMTYLGIIEQRTNELLAMYRQSSAPDAVNLSHHGPQTPLGAMAVTPSHLPTTADELESEGSDDDDDDDHPLSRDELRMRTLRGLEAKKAASARKPASRRAGRPRRGTEIDSQPPAA